MLRKGEIRKREEGDVRDVGETGACVVAAGRYKCSGTARALGEIHPNYNTESRR